MYFIRLSHEGNKFVKYITPNKNCIMISAYLMNAALKMNLEKNFNLITSKFFSFSLEIMIYIVTLFRTGIIHKTRLKVKSMLFNIKRIFNYHFSFCYILN